MAVASTGYNVILTEQTNWLSGQLTSQGNIIDQFVNLKFGQPCLLRLHSGDILATH